jgi:RNA-directed DNA polymerase
MTWNSYLGLARQASHSHQEKIALARVLLWRGHAIGGRDFTKVLRRANG